MKKFYFNLTLLASLLVAVCGKAQISQGGQPYSFSARTLLQEIPVRIMPYVDIDYLKQEDELNKEKLRPYRFGANIDVTINLENAGQWENLPNGDRLWRLAIRSEGAYSLNLLYNAFYLPDGAKFFLYNEDKSYVLGAFTNKNNREDKLFGSDLVPGSTCILEYLEPKSHLGEGVISISQVVHAYKDVLDYLKDKEAANAKASGACNVNVNCPSGNDWQVEKRAVCIIVVGGSGICTGTMINDVPQSGTPYFLTANHCTSNGTDNVGQWVFRYNYESASCTGTTGPTTQSVSGAVYRARNAGSDMALLQLSSAPPTSYNAVYAGWSREGVVVDSSICIHHPSGDIKKISKAKNQTISSTYSGAQCWRVGQWTSGVTEPGSSGSPLFDPNHRIIGQLYGGPSSCSATAANLNDYYGKFSVSWNAGNTAATRLKDWLDPQNAAPLTVDAYDPNAVSYTLDGSIQSVSSPGNGITTCTALVNPVFTLKNNGTDDLNTAVIEVTLNGNPEDTIYFNGPALATGASTNINVSGITLVSGLNSIGFNLVTVNGTTDDNLANNSRNVSLTLLIPTPVNLPVQEGFQAAVFPSNGFTIDNPDADFTWERSTTVGGFGTSTASTKISFFDYQTTGAVDYLNLPYTDFSSIVAPVNLKFDVAYARYSNSNFDSLKVSISTNCGASWNTIYAKGNTALSTNGGANVTNNNFVPTSTQWRAETINLDTYVGQSNVQIRFEAINGYGNDLYLDNINLSSDTPIGIKENNLEMELFPNPGNEIITLKSNLPIKGMDQLLNVLGQNQVLDFRKVTESDYQIDISNLTQGVYYISVQLENSTITRKFIKN